MMTTFADLVADLTRLENGTRDISFEGKTERNIPIVDDGCTGNTHHDGSFLPEDIQQSRTLDPP